MGALVREGEFSAETCVLLLLDIVVLPQAAGDAANREKAPDAHEGLQKVAGVSVCRRLGKRADNECEDGAVLDEVCISGVRQDSLRHANEKYHDPERTGDAP